MNAGSPRQAVQAEVASALQDAGAVVFTPHEPVTFKSGIVSPIYVDNRRLPFHPTAWRTVIAAFGRTVEAEGLRHEVVAGIEAAGIPHSAALAYARGEPSVFVRKQAKGHGLRSRIEGGAVEGRRVLLIEDLVSTGGSSLAGVKALREAGAVVEDCLCIASYGFGEARAAFDAAAVRLHVLAPVAAIVDEAARRGTVDDEALAAVRAWMADPRAWPAGAGTAGA